VTEVKVPGLNDIQDWKMNLLAVSERHRCLVIAKDDKLQVYDLDPLSGTLTDQALKGLF
jgi:hypothetical protein